MAKAVKPIKSTLDPAEFLKRNKPSDSEDEVAKIPQNLNLEGPFRCGANLFPTLTGVRLSCDRQKNGPHQGCLCSDLKNLGHVVEIFAPTYNRKDNHRAENSSHVKGAFTPIYTRESKHRVWLRSLIEDSPSSYYLRYKERPEKSALWDRFQELLIKVLMTASDADCKEIVLDFDEREYLHQRVEYLELMLNAGLAE